MQTNIGAFLDPKSWKEPVQKIEPLGTIFYTEYQNRGPGSNVAKRIKWAGYKPCLTASQASEFTVRSFIGGQDWIPASAVTFAQKTTNCSLEPLVSILESQRMS